MIELGIGLLGGGVLVQLIQTLLTLRQNRRQLESSALGAEVAALESAIKVLQENLESSSAYYHGEIARLRDQVAHLEGVISQMRGWNESAAGAVRASGGVDADIRC